MKTNKISDSIAAQFRAAVESNLRNTVTPSGEPLFSKSDVKGIIENLDDWYILDRIGRKHTPEQVANGYIVNRLELLAVTDEQIAQFRATFEAELRKFKGDGGAPWYSEEEIQNKLAYWATIDSIRYHIAHSGSPEALADLIYTYD